MSGAPLTTPEWSVPIKIADIPRLAQPIRLVADFAAREALALRFDLVALDRLDAEISLTQEAQGVRLSGHFAADVAQSCVATGEPVVTRLNEPVALIFMEPAFLESADSAEQEIHAESNETEAGLDAADCDVMPIEQGVIDAGEAIAQSLVLALNPYPRSPNADAFLRQAGVLAEDQAGAFGALAALRDKLKS